MSEDERGQKLVRWIRFLVIQEYVLHRSRPPSHVVSEDELAKFLEKELADNRGDRLLGLSGEEMQAQLLYRYLHGKMREEDSQIREEDLPFPDWLRRPGFSFGSGRGGPRPGPGRGPQGGHPPSGSGGPGRSGGGYGGGGRGGEDPRGPGPGNQKKPPGSGPD